ncbi:MAG: InlB B-repeat-containing protein [Acholeplasmataceae bacterium]|jgi:uncharacterized repeat protein (TIGR02543 family)|nr:InlB B-repeat-containing protein [Acholeplasmataceae bacterium]
MRKISVFMIVLLLGILLVSCGDNKLLESNDGPYTVTFHTFGGTELDEMTVEEHAFFLPSSIPTKDGYVFAGWYLDEYYYYPMAFNAGTASNLNLYAKWIDED